MEESDHLKDFDYTGEINPIPQKAYQFFPLHMNHPPRTQPKPLLFTTCTSTHPYHPSQEGLFKGTEQALVTGHVPIVMRNTVLIKLTQYQIPILTVISFLCG